MRPGDPFGDHTQRAVALAFVFKPVFADEDRVGMSAPLPHQSSAGLRHDTRIEGRAALVELYSQGPQAAPQRWARPAVGALLQIIGKGSDHQIATKTRRWSSAMQLPPGKPQILRRPIDQPGNVAFELDAGCTTRSVVATAPAENRRRPASVLASRSVIDCRFHTLAGPLMR